ncbi:hypothetical protein NS365_13380 [Aureimonas ureilytica]|uniref:Uncharacterized protein n=1 Tax=Aureimonas ureilytica TaxID=401562 RepID=A0A175RPX4_9HYPH|nr:hypothetical protein [Aureimonas ureilytica]KTR05014.1 hypothetical protein NS365_13380 [Aureimonas ureilytica]
MPAITYDQQQGIQLADVAPLPETGTAKPGNMTLVPRADHQHPRITSAQTGALDNAGMATMMFTRTFTAEPAVSILAVENNTKSPPDFKVMQFLDDQQQPWVAGKLYGGAIIYGTRTRALPGVSAVLTDLLKLSGYVPTEPAAGVRFSIIALQAS